LANFLLGSDPNRQSLILALSQPRSGPTTTILQVLLVVAHRPVEAPLGSHRLSARNQARLVHRPLVNHRSQHKEEARSLVSHRNLQRSDNHHSWDKPPRHSASQRKPQPLASRHSQDLLLAKLQL
jgi:hypothetical protein